MKEKIINLKLTISYDGSNYAGWQRLGKESSGKTIQGVLEDMLEKIIPNGSIDGKKYEITGSGRTDAGVHARAQVANVHVRSNALEDSAGRRKEVSEDSQKEVGKDKQREVNEDRQKEVDENRQKEVISEDRLKIIQRKMNSFLPEDIRIQKVEIAEQKFHSRYSAISKIYEYTIDTREKANVFTRKYALSVPKKLDLEQMKRGAEYFIGTHDFTAFSSKMKDGRSTICTIEWIEIKKENDRIHIQIKGDGFLYHMVRIMVGTLLMIGTGEKKPEEIKTILERKDRTLAGPTIDGKGLCLWEVFYEKRKEKEYGS